MKDYEYLDLTFATARNPERGKPLGYNLRLYSGVVILDDKEIPCYTVKYHNTDIVKVMPDCRAMLANGGWNTVTTMQKMREFGSNKVFSEQGQWYVWMTPDPSDPEPEYFSRTIPKPYAIDDPGPEPVKDSEGCIAGELIEQEWADYDTIHTDSDYYRPTPQQYVSKRVMYGDKLYRVKHTAGVERVFYGEKSAAGHDVNWLEFVGHVTWSTHVTVDGKGYDYVQCPHCKAFDVIHAKWNAQYNGSYWPRNHANQGYRQMVEFLERFGSVEAWHEAYLADFRERKAYLKAQREWNDRNRTPFFDGIVVDIDGYAERDRIEKVAKKLARIEAKKKTMHNKINKYVDICIEELKKGINMPGAGDCFYCMMTTKGEPLGNATSNHDHLIMHMKERYVVPALLVNALRDRGYRDVGIYFHLGMNADLGTMGGPDSNASYDQVKRDLKTYLTKRLMRHTTERTA